jgi:MFS family permease
MDKLNRVYERPNSRTNPSAKFAASVALTRSAPRDALIASSADEEHRGKAFGLEGVGDNLGAFLGPLLAVFLLLFLKLRIFSWQARWTARSGAISKVIRARSMPRTWRPSPIRRSRCLALGRTCTDKRRGSCSYQTGLR